MKYKWSTDEVQMKYKWSTNEVQMKYRWSTNEVLLKYRWSINEVQMKYKWSTQTKYSSQTRSFLKEKLRMQILSSVSSDFQTLIKH